MAAGVLALLCVVAAARQPAELVRLGLPDVPDADSLQAARIELGRKLFMDRRLSRNGTMSCGMCHVPEQGFAQNELAADGTTGAPGGQIVVRQHFQSKGGEVGEIGRDRDGVGVRFRGIARSDNRVVGQ